MASSPVIQVVRAKERIEMEMKDKEPISQETKSDL